MSNELSVALISAASLVWGGLVALVVGMAKYIHSDQKTRHKERETELLAEIEKLKGVIAAYGQETAGVPELIDRLTALVEEHDEAANPPPRRPRPSSRRAPMPPRRREGA